MIAVRIGPDFRMVVVGAPSPFASPKRPRTPQDLTGHNCIQPPPTYGGLYAWEFEKNGREPHVRVEGQLVFTGMAPMLNAALDGLGLAYLPEDLVQAPSRRGSLFGSSRTGVRRFRATTSTTEQSPALTCFLFSFLISIGQVVHRLRRSR
jgi:DNA-binding transcriptional LysR family regulator